jgi:MFS transporter, DHA1 family, multidrug resistance protein
LAEPASLQPEGASSRLEAPEAGEQFGPFAIAMVAAAVGVTSMSFNVWWPFLPLFALDLGATNGADALFWVAVATTGQGLARLASGPVWGVISDRMGRKAMFLRALYLSTFVGATAAIASAPWHLTISLTLAGLFSGFNPAAIALISVSVPESRLNRSLSLLTGVQYIGTTAGPAIGAILATTFDYRGAILVTSVVPILTGTAVLFFVPADRVNARPRIDGGSRPPVELEPFRLSFQLLLAIFLYGLIFAFNQLIRFATPIALKGIEGREDVAGDAGLTFTLGGLGSAISVLVLAPFFFSAGRMRLALGVSCLLGAGGFVLIAVAGATLSFIVGFLVIAMVLSAMTPAVNTLIASNVTRSRRGTAFGVAGSSQAISSMVGPAAAALFAVISFQLGFALLAVFMLLVALLLFAVLREPRLDETLT